MIGQRPMSRSMRVFHRGRIEDRARFFLGAFQGVSRHFPGHFGGLVFCAAGAVFAAPGCPARGCGVTAPRAVILRPSGIGKSGMAMLGGRKHDGILLRQLGRSGAQGSQAMSNAVEPVGAAAADGATPCPLRVHVRYIRSASERPEAPTPHHPQLLPPWVMAP